MDPDILDEIARRKTVGAEEAVQVLNQEETENEYSGLRIVDPKDIVWESDRLSVIEDKESHHFLLIESGAEKRCEKAASRSDSGMQFQPGIEKTDSDFHRKRFLCADSGLSGQQDRRGLPDRRHEALGSDH